MNGPREEPLQAELAAKYERELAESKIHNYPPIARFPEKQPRPERRRDRRKNRRRR